MGIRKIIYYIKKNGTRRAKSIGEMNRLSRNMNEWKNWIGRKEGSTNQNPTPLMA